MDPLIVGAILTLACLGGWGVWRWRASRRRRGEGPAAAAVLPHEGGSRDTRQRLRDSLRTTRAGLWGRLQSAWGGGAGPAAQFAALEEILLAGDVGVKATNALLGRLQARAGALGDVEALRAALREEMRTLLADADGATISTKPHVILVAGVNGVGKTTTIGKLAYAYRADGKSVLLVAGDTFRAAAAEQLETWAQRVGAECVRHQAGSDPGAVVHDGITAAVARGADVVIVDTAGRLHVKQHLVEELKKVHRVIGRLVAGAPHEVLLVIDATTGQNAIVQARVFQEALPVTGIVLSKLDGTAKGGAAFAIHAELGLPIRYVGSGERPGDLAPFSADEFVDALLAVPDGASGGAALS